ncbi:MAG: hypothetical protein R6V84_17935 [Desulfobacterales bacterium]
MDAKSYCSTVTHELTAWKAKIYDVIARSEKLPAKQQKKVAPVIGDLNAVIDDLEVRLDRLSRECPGQFGAERDAIKAKMGEMQGAWKRVWGAMGEEEYGIGGA